MKISKRALAGATLFAALAFVTGCQGSTPTSSNDADPPATTRSASEELTDAMKKLNSTSYSFSMNFGPGEMTGAVDAANKAVKMAMEIEAEGQSLAFDIVVIDTDMYMKIEGLPLPGLAPGKYLHLDATKVTSLENFGLQDLSDPTQAAQLMEQLVDVEKTGDGTFKGTIDMSKLDQLDEDIQALGDQAKSIPFEATVDGEGRLTLMKMMVPAGGSTPAMDIEMKYSDFGSASAISAPAAGDVVEAPAEMYQMFGA